MLARESRDRRLPAPSPRLAILLGSIAAAFIAFVGAVARQQGVPRYRTVWAEDGAVFGQCPLLDPLPPSCLFAPYDGWVHLLPRSLGWATSSLPLEWFSYTATALAAIVVMGCAFLVARAVAEASGSVIAGTVAGASLALVYPAGAEVAGNITNVPWIMFVASATLLACALLSRPIGKMDAALILATLVSTAFGLLLVALLGLETMLARDRGRGTPKLLVVAAGIAIAQVAVALVSPRNEVPNLPVTLLSPVSWFFDLVFRKGPFGGRGLVPGWVPGVLVSGVIAALAWAGYRSLVRDRAGADPPLDSKSAASWWRAPVALLSLGIACAAVFAASTYLNRHVTARYEYVPAAGMVIALMLGLALLLNQRPRAVSVLGRQISGSTLAVGSVALVVALGFGTTFRVSTGASSGPSYPAALREAMQACQHGFEFAVVTISPLPAGSVTATWSMTIPCARLGA
jgi:hypothetical protein